MRRAPLVMSGSSTHFRRTDNAQRLKVPSLQEMDG
jgi:hypothetical protein